MLMAFVPLITIPQPQFRSILGHGDGANRSHVSHEEHEASIRRAGDTKGLHCHLGNILSDPSILFRYPRTLCFKQD
jgi:hypothetical protein